MFKINTLCVFWTLLAIILNFNLLAQVNKKINTKGTLINLHYGIQWSGGDLGDRFGRSFNVGTDILYMTKSKWLFGGTYQFIFGGEIKEDVLANLRTTEGQIIGQNNDFAVVSANQRGYFIGGTVGKLFPLFKDDERHFIKLTITGGFLRHRIRLDDQAGAVPQLAGEYIKGYDRLTSGIALGEFLGYQYLSSNRLVNIYAGFDFMQGFTESRRSFNYDTMEAETGNRLDVLAGFRVGWILPLYNQDADTIYY